MGNMCCRRVGYSPNGAEVDNGRCHQQQQQASEVEHQPKSPLMSSAYHSAGDDCAINELLEGRMDLDVVLPDGRKVRLTVERRTPMMDLLVQAASATKISPAGHTIHVYSDDGKGNSTLHYKPSTPIGSLDANTICIVPKKDSLDSSARRFPKMANRPFEPTFRVQVHLPRNQLTVVRVSPRVKISELRNMVCQEKGLDTSRYQLVRPSVRGQPLSGDLTLAEYGSTEITLLSNSCIESHICNSTSHIMPYSKRIEEQKRKTGILRLLAEDANQKVQRKATIQRPAPTIKITEAPHPGRYKPKKRRPAPPPPPPTLPEPPFHSRQSSSDSSGYHEATSSFLHEEHCVEDKASSDSSGVSSLDAKVATVQNTKKRKAPLPPPPPEGGGQVNPVTIDVKIRPPSSEGLADNTVEKREEPAPKIPVQSPVIDKVTQHAELQNPKQDSTARDTKKESEGVAKVALVALNARIEQDVTQQEIASSIQAAFHSVDSTQRTAGPSLLAIKQRGGSTSASVSSLSSTPDAKQPLESETSASAAPSNGFSKSKGVSLTSTRQPTEQHQPPVSSAETNKRSAGVLPTSTRQPTDQNLDHQRPVPTAEINNRPAGVFPGVSSTSTRQPTDQHLDQRPVPSSESNKRSSGVLPTSTRQSTDQHLDHQPPVPSSESNKRSAGVVPTSSTRQPTDQHLDHQRPVASSESNKVSLGVSPNSTRQPTEQRLDHQHPVLTAEINNRPAGVSSTTTKTPAEQKSDRRPSVSITEYSKRCVEVSQTSTKQPNQQSVDCKNSRDRSSTRAVEDLPTTGHARYSTERSSPTFASEQSLNKQPLVGERFPSSCEASISVKEEQPTDGFAQHSIGLFSTSSANQLLSLPTDQSLKTITPSGEFAQELSSVPYIESVSDDGLTENVGAYPLQKSSARLNFEAKNDLEDGLQTFPPPPSEFRSVENDPPLIDDPIPCPPTFRSTPSSTLRRSSSLLNLTDTTPQRVAASKSKKVRHLQRSLSDLTVDDKGEFEAEQARLQHEYLKLQRQFIVWQQQLLNNHAMLREECIVPQYARTLRQSHSLPEGQDYPEESNGSCPLVSRSLSYEPTKCSTLPRSTINIPPLEFGSAPVINGSSTLRSSKTKSYFKPPQVRVSTKNRQRLPPEIRKDGDLDIYDDAKILSTILPTFDSLKLISESNDDDLDMILKPVGREVVKKVPPPVPNKLATLPKPDMNRQNNEKNRNGHVNGESVRIGEAVRQTVQSNGSHPPSPPPLPVVNKDSGSDKGKSVSKPKTVVEKKVIIPQVDPREQLMQEIRRCGGRTALRKISLDIAS